MAIISDGTTMADAGAFSASLGSMIHIKTLTLSNAATASFVDGASSVVLDNTYPIYKISFIGMNSRSDNVHFTWQASVNTGSGYGVATTSSFFEAFHAQNDAEAGIAYDHRYDNHNSTSFTKLDRASSSTTSRVGSGEMFLFNPSSTTFVKNWHCRYQGALRASYCDEFYVAGYVNTTSAVDAIQFKYSGGNMDGKIKLYGIKDS